MLNCPLLFVQYHIQCLIAPQPWWFLIQPFVKYQQERIFHCLPSFLFLLPILSLYFVYCYEFFLQVILNARHAASCLFTSKVSNSGSACVVWCTFTFVLENCQFQAPIKNVQCIGNATLLYRLTFCATALQCWLTWLVHYDPRSLLNLCFNLGQ